MTVKFYSPALLWKYFEKGTLFLFWAHTSEKIWHMSPIHKTKSIGIKRLTWWWKLGATRLDKITRWNTLPGVWRFEIVFITLCNSYSRLKSSKWLCCYLADHLQKRNHLIRVDVSFGYRVMGTYVTNATEALQFLLKDLRGRFWRMRTYASKWEKLLSFLWIAGLKICACVKKKYRPSS